MAEPRSQNFGPLHSQIASALWEWRFELLFGYIVMTLWWLAARAVGDTGAQVVLTAGGVVALGCERTRRFLAASLRRSAVRRHWSRATRMCGLFGPLGDRPVARSVVHIWVGDRLVVHMPVGTHVGDLEAAREPLAAAMGVRDIRIRRDTEDASIAHVVVVRRDPLATGSLAWPLSLVDRWSLWRPIPVGIDEDGG